MLAIGPGTPQTPAGRCKHRPLRISRPLHQNHTPRAAHTLGVFFVSLYPFYAPPGGKTQTVTHPPHFSAAANPRFRGNPRNRARGSGCNRGSRKIASRPNFSYSLACSPAKRCFFSGSFSSEPRGLALMVVEFGVGRPDHPPAGLAQPQAEIDVVEGDGELFVHPLQPRQTPRCAQAGRPPSRPKNPARWPA